MSKKPAASAAARTDAPHPKRSKRRMGLMIGGAILTVGALAFAGTGISQALSSGANYRTATAERAAVSETVQASGTLAAADRFDVAFQTGGTISTVDVALGDTVTAGQQLATIDSSDLEEAVSKAESDVTDARQTLAEHIESQSAGTVSSSTNSSTQTAQTSSEQGSATASSAPATSGETPSSAAPSPGTASGSGGSDDGTAQDPAVAQAAAAVTAAQQAMLAKYGEVQGAIEDSNATIASSDEVCAVFLEAVLQVDSGDTDPEGGEGAESAVVTAEDTTDVDAGISAGMTLEEAQQALASCQTAINEVRDGQALVGAGQLEVQALAADLDAAVAELLSAITASDSSGAGAGSGAGSGAASGADSSASVGSNAGSSSAGATSGSSLGSDSMSSGAASGTSVTITAAQLLADQAAIDLADSQLLIAQAQLRFSSLTSPIAGTVAAVGLSVSDTVTAASTSAVITVVGDGGFVAEATISLSDIPKLAIGQDVEATTNATGNTYRGLVSMVGILNVSTTSTPAYAVTVALDTGDDQLLIGGSARLVFQTANAEDVLTVPTSAVHQSGNIATVNVLNGSTSEAVTVELGAMGSERVEIISGLEAGQKVILADLSAAIDSGDETESTGLTGLGGSSGDQSGAFPGGSGGGGDFPSPPSGGFGG